MKTLAIALALTLSACAASLQNQALLVVSAGAVMTDVGHAIQAGSDAAYAARPGCCDAAQMAALDADWAPLTALYQFTKAALKAYEVAIAKANQLGDTTLVQAPARTLLEQWTQMYALAGRLKLEAIPPPPSGLAKLAGGGS